MIPFELSAITLADKGLLLVLMFSVFILLLARFKSKVLDYVIAIMFATAVSELIKYLVNAPRPLAAFEGSAFPSTHTTLAFCSVAFYVFVCHSSSFFQNREGESRARLGLGEGLTIIALSIFAVAIAFSRVVIGAHSILDVIAGGVLGILAIIPFMFYDVSGRRIR